MRRFERQKTTSTYGAAFKVMLHSLSYEFVRKKAQGGVVPKIGLVRVVLSASHSTHEGLNVPIETWWPDVAEECETTPLG